MSRGKQWWPLRATTKEAREAIMTFQERCRDRQWLGRYEKVAPFHVYTFNGIFPGIEELDGINDYIQISNQDSMVKNNARISILRLLCMMLKIHIGIRPKQRLLFEPRICLVPSFKSEEFKYAIIAVIESDDLAEGSKPLTLFISEFEINDGVEKNQGKFLIPQSKDTFKWLTVKTWMSQAKKPSFGKWIYGDYSEKKKWVDGLIADARVNKDGGEERLDETLKEHGLFTWQAEGDFKSQENTNKIEVIKKMGGYFSWEMKKWFLPIFFEKEALEEYLPHAPLVDIGYRKYKSK